MFYAIIMSFLNRFGLVVCWTSYSSWPMRVMCTFVCVCVCVWQRDRYRERLCDDCFCILFLLLALWTL